MCFESLSLVYVHNMMCKHILTVPEDESNDSLGLTAIKFSSIYRIFSALNNTYLGTYVAYCYNFMHKLSKVHK